MTTVNVGARAVGDGHPCYVIAEVGSNHNRDLDTARRLIDEAAEAGADAVKFQTYSGTSLYSTKAPRFESLEGFTAKAPHQVLEDISLPREWQPILAQHCRERGIEFLSSPFDYQAVDELDSLAVAALKVASFEIVDLPFLEYIGSKGKPVIISTGMATMEEIEEAMAAARKGGATDFCLLQCASVYPSPAHLANLRAIPTMKAAFGVPVGLSDHSLGIHIPVAAAAIGADMIEKHCTLDRGYPGPDHPFAIEPGELKDMVTQIHEAEAALGDGRKLGPSDEERVEMFTKARRSVIAACDIPAGTRIAREMLTVKRPGYGVKPRDIGALVGRVASTHIEADEVITWEML